MTAGRLVRPLRVGRSRHRVGQAQCGGELAWYRTRGGVQVDFLWNGPDHRIGIEVKASTRWRTEYGASLNEMLEEKVIRRGYGVYLGDRALVDGGVRVLPAKQWAWTLGATLTPP